jgi:DNA repair protein RAD7
LDAEERRNAALASWEAENNREEQSGDEEPEEEKSEKVKPLTKAQKARQEAREKAVAKAKASKKFQMAQKKGKNGANFSDSGDADEDLYNPRNLPKVGQFDSCQICTARFTVTAYSRTGPDGGLLCMNCTKELDDEEEGPRKKRRTATRYNRRKIESERLEGVSTRGARDLVSQCVSTLANNVHQAEDFGDLPPRLVDKLAQLLSKKRMLDSRTLDLFLKPGAANITAYDGAKLNSDDYTRIFQVVPGVRHLRLRNAIQFKERVMDYLTASTVELESLSLHGANLIDDEHWTSFLMAKGCHLRSLKVYHTDVSFGDEVMRSIKDLCPNLTRLKICHNQKVTSAGLRHIASLRHLQHLSLDLYKSTTTEPYIEILTRIGASLQTLSLVGIPNLDDSLLEAIHTHCTSLSKLRLKRNETFTDAAFAALFTDWRNPALRIVDLGECRHVDSLTLDNSDGVGLCSAGFEALIAHSGRHLSSLNLLSCRHIERAAFERVFAEGKTYPELETVDVSFCGNMDDFVVGCLWRSCPAVKNLKVFGCFGVKDVRVPRGRNLLGNPNARGMLIEGEDK